MNNEIKSRDWHVVIHDGKFHIQLLHHIDSGRIVVKSNSQEILKFNIDELEQDAVSFFLGETLCKINIKNKEEHYHYELIIDNDTPTELNKQKKQIESSNLKKTLLYLCLPIFVLCLIAFTLVKIYNNKHKTPAWQANAAYTYGVVNSEINDPKWPLNTSYTYKVDTTHYMGWTNLDRTQGNVRVSQSGMPVQPGDMFVVHYDKKENNISRMLFDQPTNDQLVRYKIQLMTSVPMGVDAVCFLDKLYEWNGLNAWANIWFAELQPSWNAKCNMETYNQMMQNDTVKNILNSCKK